MNVDDTHDPRLYSWDNKGIDDTPDRDAFEFQCAIKNASRWLESVDEYDRLIAEQGRPHMNIYHPHTNSFWFGVVCGICIATSAAMFMIVTRLLGIWT